MEEKEKVDVKDIQIKMEKQKRIILLDVIVAVLWLVGLIFIIISLTKQDTLKWYNYLSIVSLSFCIGTRIEKFFWHLSEYMDLSIAKDDLEMKKKKEELKDLLGEYEK